MLDGGDDGGEWENILKYEGLTEQKDATGHNIKVLYKGESRRSTEFRFTLLGSGDIRPRTYT
jgi:hypothetical protein